ncbi:MAG: DUF4287 domain-containing protein [Acidobacteria bacterium]|nr:DUF4287 domain-containing protein [Acidobacteriota bacterium]MCI0666363.1 DUF4287 domain-containing protein [Acidobacteriota bacterium]
MKKIDDATQNMIRNLEEKTGKSFAKWLEIARAGKMTKHGEIVKLLKTEHSLTHGYANLVAHKALGSDAGETEDDDLIAAQYAGAKAALRPIYEKLIAAVSSFGDDVEIAPKKAYVSLRRKKQFGCIQPSTATRMDVGINLKGVAAKGRLEASGSFNAMVSHRVRVSDLAEIDEELIRWLRQAYEAS